MDRSDANVENVNLTTTRIVMPSTDVSIQATYRDKPGALFELSIANGTGSGEYAAAVTVAMIADAPPAGFVFAGDVWDALNLLT